MTSSTPSWELLHRGTAQQFIDALRTDALAHRAVHHPYLKRLAAGEFPDVTWAVRDYAYQYMFYSRDFALYLEGLIEALDSEAHREQLRENLREEQGDPGSKDFRQLPHRVLFERFQRRMGIDEEFLERNSPCPTVLVWRDLFLQKCRSNQPGVGLGGMGLGTEFVVSSIYGFILEALEKHTDLSEDDVYFFRLHASCDDEHAEDLIEITSELAREHEHRETIRFGVLSALNLRAAFWDVMLSRALHMTQE